MRAMIPTPKLRLAAVAVAALPTLFAAPAGSAFAPQASAAAPVDLSGIWGGRYQFSIAKDPPMLPPALAIFKARKPEDDPLARCKPPGVPRVMNMAFPIEIIQTPKVIYFLLEYDHSIRRVFLNAEHPKDVEPTWLGHSVGRWDGTTLVVDTIGLSDETWLDEQALPHSTDLHVVERYSLSADGKSLAQQVTLEDPKMYSRPITYSKSYPLRNDLTIMEWECEVD